MPYWRNWNAAPFRTVRTIQIQFLVAWISNPHRRASFPKHQRPCQRRVTQVPWRCSSCIQPISRNPMSTVRSKSQNNQSYLLRPQQLLSWMSSWPTWTNFRPRFQWKQMLAGNPCQTSRITRHLSTQCLGVWNRNYKILGLLQSPRATVLPARNQLLGRWSMLWGNPGTQSTLSVLTARRSLAPVPSLNEMG